MTEDEYNKDRAEMKRIGWSIAQVVSYFTGRIVKPIKQGPKRARCIECGLRIRGVGHKEGSHHRDVLRKKLKLGVR